MHDFCMIDEPNHNHYVLVMYLRPLCVYPDCARTMPWTFAAVQMVQARTSDALGVFICIMSDAFRVPSLFQNNVFQNNWALKSLAKWCAVMRLLNRHAKETIDLQVAKLPSSAYYALASVLYTGPRLKRNKGGVTEIGIVPLRCRSCGLLRTPKQNIVRVDGCAPTFYVGELCCLLPKKREILESTSIMKLLEVLFCRARYEVSVL